MRVELYWLDVNQVGFCLHNGLWPAAPSAADIKDDGVIFCFDDKVVAGSFVEVHNVIQVDNDRAGGISLIQLDVNGVWNWIAVFKGVNGAVDSAVDGAGEAGELFDREHYFNETACRDLLSGGEWDPIFSLYIGIAGVVVDPVEWNFSRCEGI